LSPSESFPEASFARKAVEPGHGQPIEDTQRMVNIFTFVGGRYIKQKWWRSKAFKG
jgi:hypothetical protein